jgi:hypothetical protein
MVSGRVWIPAPCGDVHFAEIRKNFDGLAAAWSGAGVVPGNAATASGQPRPGGRGIAAAMPAPGDGRRKSGEQRGGGDGGHGGWRRRLAELVATACLRSVP